MIDEREIDFRYAPDKSQTCIGLVDDPFKTLVMDDGSIAFDYDQSGDPYYYPAMAMQVYPRLVQNRGFHKRFKPEILHRDELLERRQDFGLAERAIVTTLERYRHCTFSWVCFAWKPDDQLRADVILWKLETNSDFRKTRTGVALYVLGEEPEEGSVCAAQNSLGQGAVYEKNGWFLEANGCMEGAFFVVHKGVLPEERQTVQTAREALHWAENYWDNVKPFQNRFEIPDEEIMEMLNACGRNILQAREIHDGVPVYQVGPTCYRGLWIADGLFMLEAAFILGTVETVEDGLCALLRRVHPNGSIYAIPFHEKETAIAIFTMIRQCSISGDFDRLKELWPTIKRGFDFLKARVESSYECGEDYPASGLYPPSYGDGGVNGLEPEYTTPLWIMAALKAAVDVGKREGFDAWENMASMLQSMLACYRTAYTRDRKVTPDGAAYVKTSMLTDEQMEEHIRNHSRYDRDGEVCNWGGYTPQCGTWTLAQVISMGELFDEDDLVVGDFLTLLDSCDDAEGIPQDTGWVTEGAVWGYSAMFYAQVFLYAGMPEKAEQYLYAFANHASRARCWREEQALTGTQCSAIWGDMPHNWGSAEFIRLVRCMLVHEKKNDLYLLDALPEKWLPTGENGIVLENTPTRFGRVTMRLSKTENGYCLSVSTRFHRAPDAIRVRVPEGFTADGNNSEGRYFVFDGGEQIVLSLLRKV